MGIFAFLGTQEIIIILVLALIVFGPQKLPEVGRQIGAAMRELRKMSGDVQRALDIDEFTGGAFGGLGSSLDVSGQWHEPQPGPSLVLPSAPYGGVVSQATSPMLADGEIASSMDAAASSGAHSFETP